MICKKFFSLTSRFVRSVLVFIFVLLAVVSSPALTVQAATPKRNTQDFYPYLINAASVQTTKVLTANKAIATWLSNIPGGERRPVLVFLPGWGGVGSVNAYVSSQNINFVNEGYVTLAIGFDSSAVWTSDIAQKTLEGLNKLCTDVSIPANCNAIILVGGSYGGAQNYWVIEYLLDNGYSGGGKKAIGFLSEDAGYAAPGFFTNENTGAYTRTGLANTASYSVAMIENLGDTTFPVDECTWSNCGARELSNAHFARGDSNVFSVCPAGGEHGTRGYADWNGWVISAIKTMFHVTSGIPTFTGYTSPTLFVGNTCASGYVATTTLVNSVLPTSRTVLVGSTATIFNTVVNSGNQIAQDVILTMASSPAGTFSYSQTNCATNAIIGEINPSVDIAPSGVACFVLLFTPSLPFSARHVHIRAQASNAPATTLLLGINTWLLRATDIFGPDIIALTTTTDFHQIACLGTNAFAVALANVGAAATGNITVSANTGAVNLPLSILIQETDPGTGVTIGDNILQNIGAGENRTVVVFVTFYGCVNFDPAANRIFIEFKDTFNNVIGSTSTAVSTNR